MQNLWRAILLAVVAASSAAATLGDAMPASVLVERCRGFIQDSSSVRGELCESYLRGFMAGASTRGFVRGGTGPPNETFAQRALRTRMGLTQPRPEYCVAADVSMNSLIARFIEHSQARDLDGVAAENLVRQMLIAEFPCER